MNPDIRRKLDRITDILWAGGTTNPVTYIEQISYLIYLKLLDEREAEIELQSRLLGPSSGRGDGTGYGGGSGSGAGNSDGTGWGNGNRRSLYPKQAQRFRWYRFRERSGEDLRDFVRDEVFPYMAGLVKESPRVAEYFRDAVLEIVDPAVLTQVVNEIDTIPFSKLGTDIKGDIFEYLLTHLGQSALNGQFRTPRQIRVMMVQMVDPDFGDTIFDPACGTGGFLIDAVSYVLAKYSAEPAEVPIYGEEWLERKGQTLRQAKKQIPNLQTYRKGPGEKLPDWQTLEHCVFGIDVSRQMMRIAMMNLVLHGIQDAPIKRGNTLSEIGGLTEDDLARKYKVILSNPPFAGTLPKDSIRKDLPTNSKKSELLFLGVMMEALAPGGRCAVVVPEGLLFGSTSAHTDLREKLLTHFDLLAVVSLPAGVFKPYAGVKTAVLVFRRPFDPKKLDKKAKVWFYEVRNDGFDPDRIVQGGRPETPGLNDIPDLLQQWTKYTASSFKSPPGVGANTILEAGSEAPRCWWATIAAVKTNGFNLAAGRYKPTIGTAAPNDDPVELIRSVCDDQKDIVTGYEKLLSNVEAVR